MAKGRTDPRHYPIKPSHLTPLQQYQAQNKTPPQYRGGVLNRIKCHVIRSDQNTTLGNQFAKDGQSQMTKMPNT